MEHEPNTTYLVRPPTEDKEEKRRDEEEAKGEEGEEDEDKGEEDNDIQPVEEQDGEERREAGEEEVLRDGEEGELPDDEPRRKKKSRAGKEESAVKDFSSTRGEAAAKAIRKPDEPTKAERLAHAVCHYPYRSWCVDCVRGRGVESPHASTVDKDEDAAPLFSGDYGFISEGTQGSSSSSSEGVRNVTILALVDGKTNSGQALEVPHKGAAHPWIARKIADWINALGYNRVRFRNDQEKSR